MVPSLLLLVCFCAVPQLSTACCPERERNAARGNAQPPSAPQVSSNYAKNPCATPKNVDTFNKAFLAAVDKCALLTGIFNGLKSLTHDEHHAAAFTTATVYRSQGGYSNPTEDANRATETIVQNCKPLSPNIVKAIYANLGSKMLNENGKLNGENAAKLAAEYANTMKNAAKIFAGKNCPRSEAQAILVGYFNFIKDQGLFEPDTRTPSSLITRNEVRCQDRNPGPPQKNCPIANFSPAKPLLKESDEVCKIRSKAIDTFVATFRDQVRRCKTLTNLFRVRPDVSPQEMSRVTYYVSLLLLGQNGGEKPRDLADFMSRFIKDVKPLKISQVEGVHARFIAKFLESAKMLDTKNAKAQAIKLAGAMKKRADQVVDNRWPTSKAIAIQLGWRYFLDLDQLLSKETASKMAYLYGNEWRCEANSST